MARFIVPFLVTVIGIALIYFKPEYSQQVVQYLKQWLPFQNSCLTGNETLFTAQDLKQFDGRDAEKGIYLAFLGVVYNVSRGIKHYGPGGTYSIFAGRDATRAFVTGNFDEEQLQDDVSDLETAAFSGIREWAQFYQKDYIAIGRLVGSYYDSSGCPTAKLQRVHAKYEELDRQESEKKQEETQYPPCNSEWAQETKVTRFWCTKMSGGVKRDWTGVPRLYFSDTKTSRCACAPSREEQDREPSIEYDDSEADPMLRQYDGCSPTSTQCFVPDPE